MKIVSHPHTNGAQVIPKGVVIHSSARQEELEVVRIRPRFQSARQRGRRAGPLIHRRNSVWIRCVARCMRAVGVTEFGGPEALQEHDVAEPAASPGEVRLRVHAAAVNPTDTYVRNGARRKSLEEYDPPYVPGMDVAGVVDAIGEGTRTDLAVGDRAMGIVLPMGSHGAYVEKTVLPAESVTRAPAGTSHAEAATLPMNGLTARMSLDLLNLAPGSTLAVTGAAGAYGGYVIQLAKEAGLRVVADAVSKDEQLVRDLGADVVVPRGEQVAEAIRNEVPDGVDGLADGSVQGEPLLPAVRDGGDHWPQNALLSQPRVLG